MENLFPMLLSHFLETIFQELKVFLYKKKKKVKPYFHCLAQCIKLSLTIHVIH